jgi:hypothetical protein
MANGETTSNADTGRSSTEMETNTKVSGLMANSTEKAHMWRKATAHTLARSKRASTTAKE